MGSGQTFPRRRGWLKQRARGGKPGAADGWPRGGARAPSGRGPPGPRTRSGRPPRKARCRLMRRPYQNRHRWEGAQTHQGAREKPRQGTRQHSPVTSGEGVPREGAQRTGPCSCLTKTQHSANARAETWSVTRDQCGKVKARSQPRGVADGQQANIPAPAWRV